MSMSMGLTLLPLLILANAFFVAAEYAIVSLRPSQIDSMRRAGRRASATALEALRLDPAGSIGAIQVCITMTNLLLGWIGEPAMSQLLQRALGPLSQWIPPGVFTVFSVGLSFIVVTLLTVVFSELLPKAVTIRHAPSIALVTAVPTLAIRRGIKPLVWLMTAMANWVTRPLGLGRVEDMEAQGHTREEMVAMTTQAAADGVLTADERKLILNTLSLGRRRANQIMVSRVSVDYLDLTRPMSGNLRVLESHLHSRLPLCDGGMDKVFGVVTTKEFLWAWEGDSQTATDSSVLQLLAKPAVFVPETLSVDKLLPIFQQNQTQMLFLVSEYGGVEGLVTLSDVLDEILGNDHEARGAATVPAESPKP